MSAVTRITLCADDFASDEATTSAILELAARGSISAVSCFSDAPSWPKGGRSLTPFRDRVLIGLHFNLTHSFDDRRRSLPKTILESLTRRLDPNTIRASLLQQVERFAEVVGEWPDYIDGHEHVHVLPVVADVVREVAAELPAATPIPVRFVGRFFGPTDAPCKRAVIRRLAALGGVGAGGAQRTLNSALAGDYSLRPQADFPALFAAWVAAAPDRGLIMCHPRRDRRGRAPSAGQRELDVLTAPRPVFGSDDPATRFLERAELANDRFGLPTPSNQSCGAHMADTP